MQVNERVTRQPRFLAPQREIHVVLIAGQASFGQALTLSILYS
jgi:hypothetical protein